MTAILFRLKKERPEYRENASVTNIDARSVTLVATLTAEQAQAMRAAYMGTRASSRVRAPVLDQDGASVAGSEGDGGLGDGG